MYNNMSASSESLEKIASPSTRAHDDDDDDDNCVCNLPRKVVCIGHYLGDLGGIGGIRSTRVRDLMSGLTEDNTTGTNAFAHYYFFDELLGDVVVKELTKNEAYKEGKARFDLAQFNASSSWNKYICLSLIIRGRPHNQSAVSQLVASMRETLDSLFAETSNVLAELFNVPTAQVDVLLNSCASSPHESLRKFDTIWYFCKRDFCYDEPAVQSWLAAEFLKYAETFLVNDIAGSPELFCSGLIYFLRVFTMWQTYPECQDWINKIEKKIRLILKEWILCPENDDDHPPPIEDATTQNIIIRRANEIMRSTLTYDITGLSSSSAKKWRRGSFVDVKPSVLASQWIRTKNDMWRRCETRQE